jgi:cytochrome c
MSQLWGGFRMNAKVLFTVGLVIAGSFWAITPGVSQQAPPESEKAKQIVALVDKAAKEIDSKGKAAFPEFRKSGSEWFSDETYLFISDLKGTALFNAAFPKLEGTDSMGLKDANGKLFVQEFTKVVESKGAGWVDYMWPKPGKTQPSEKWSYVKAVKIDGAPGYVGAGLYSQ